MYINHLIMHVYYLWISVEAGLAGADGPVLDDVALGVAAAGARVLADGVDAGQRVVAPGEAKEIFETLMVHKFAAI